MRQMYAYYKYDYLSRVKMGGKSLLSVLSGIITTGLTVRGTILKLDPSPSNWLLTMIQ